MAALKKRATASDPSKRTTDVSAIYSLNLTCAALQKAEVADNTITAENVWRKKIVDK